MSAADPDSPYAELSVALRLPGRRRDVALWSPFTALTGYRDGLGPFPAGPPALALAWRDPQVGWRPAGVAIPRPDIPRAPASTAPVRAVPAPTATAPLRAGAAAPSAIRMPRPTDTPAAPDDAPAATTPPTSTRTPVLVARLAALAAGTHRPDNRVRHSSEAAPRAPGGPGRPTPRTPDPTGVPPPGRTAPCPAAPSPAVAVAASSPAGVPPPGRPVLIERLTTLAGRPGMRNGTGGAAPAPHRETPRQDRPVITPAPAAGPAHPATISPHQLAALPQPAHVAPYPIAVAAAAPRESTTRSARGTRPPSEHRHHEVFDALTDNAVRALGGRLAELARDEQFRLGRRR